MRLDYGNILSKPFLAAAQGWFQRVWFGFVILPQIFAITSAAGELESNIIAHRMVSFRRRVCRWYWSSAVMALETFAGQWLFRRTAGASHYSSAPGPFQEAPLFWCSALVKVVALLSLSAWLIFPPRAILLLLNDPYYCVIFCLCCNINGRLTPSSWGLRWWALTVPIVEFY